MNSSANNWTEAYRKGRQWYEKGRFDKAVEYFQASIAIKPDHAESYHDLGAALYAERRYEVALSSFQKAVELNGQMASAWFNGGNVLCRVNRFDTAIQWYEQALSVSPGHADAHYNLGNVHKMLGNLKVALGHYQAALSIDPRFAEARNNMGSLYLKDGQLDKALECFQAAMALKPGYYEAAYNAAVGLQRLGRLEQAIESARRALTIRPDDGDALALLSALLRQACDWANVPVVDRMLSQLTERQLQEGRRPSEQPFLSFVRSASPGHNFQVASAWSRWLISGQQGREHQFAHPPHRYRSRPMTIGYLSEQFRNAATAHLTAGLFERHSRDGFRIIAYSWGDDDGSPYRRKIESDTDLFVNIKALSDSEAAQRIYDDRVNILVDLMGWMHGHRMGILLQRPAPIQVNYLGYPGTTGAPFVDYILADTIVIPKDHHRFFSEEVVYLPHCYQATDPSPWVDGREMTRAGAGLPEDRLVFCAFTTDYKIEPLSFGCWMQILHAVPQSVMWLIAPSDLTRKNLLQHARLQGIDPRRIVFADPLPKPMHLARISLADIALDTFTVNGHTTTSDTLWAGVPLVTLQGTHFASRVASSILSAAGLNELVAESLSDYKRLAIELALNPDRLKTLKTKLACRKAGMPLFDTDRLVQNLEQAYSRMWHQFASGRDRESFAIEAQ
jgi:protein O-GlcNAc transferase